MLHELLEYAQREGLASEPGFKAKPVRWLLNFDPQGRWVGVSDQAGGDKKSKGRLFRACPDLSQPEMVAAGKGTRHFLVDALDKVVLLTKDGKVTEKLACEHDFFVSLLEQASCDVPMLGTIARSLRDPAVLERIRSDLQAQKARPTDSATVAVMDATGHNDVPVESNAWHDWWRGFRQQLTEARQSRVGKASADGRSMICLLSGKPTTPVATHPKINGLSDVGGLAMGDALLSFDKDAFTSFGLEQGQNAALSEQMATTYTGALNDLLRSRVRRLAGLKIAYWYDREVDDLCDDLMEADDGAFGEPMPPPSPTQLSANEIRGLESRAAKLLKAIETGEKPDLIDAQYFALTLSANSGRVMVRDWMQGQFVDLVRAVKQWFDDLSIVARDGQSIVVQHKFLAVVGACVRDLKDAPASLQAALWRAALDVTRQPFPNQVMAQALRRVQLDVINGESPRHNRMGLLKACLLRKGYSMTATLNEHETHPAYLCGRILALLGRIQNRALGDVGAGVIQRYYAAASATPALVLGRLVRTAQTGHLPKIKPGLRHWFESQLVEIWDRLDRRVPATLTLEEQTLFAMGYYQQQAKREKQGDTDTSED